MTPCYRLIIISAGDFGRELASLARSIPEPLREWEFTGFLDSRPTILDAYPGEGPILGDPENYEIKPNDRFICAIGTPRSRLHYAELIESRGGVFTSIVHPTALVGCRTEIGRGCIICPRVEITVDVVIGSHASIMSNCVIGHNARIGDGSVLSAFSFIGGHAVLGRGVFLGPHAAVVPKKKIGDFATVGIGSVALRNVSEAESVFGVPAKEFGAARQD